MGYPSCSSVGYPSLLLRVLTVLPTFRVLTVLPTFRVLNPCSCPAARGLSLLLPCCPWLTPMNVKDSNTDEREERHHQ